MFLFVGLTFVVMACGISLLWGRCIVSPCYGRVIVHWVHCCVGMSSGSHKDYTGNVLKDKCIIRV